LYVFGVDDVCFEECWGNFGVVVIMILVGIGGVFVCAIVFGCVFF